MIIRYTTVHAVYSPSGQTILDYNERETFSLTNVRLSDC